jgi:hypothetical protein
MAGIPGKCPRDVRQANPKKSSYKNSYNRASSGGSVKHNTMKIFSGADGSRTHDLLNAIIPSLSRASYSWKKYSAFLAAEGQQFFRF